MLLISCRIDPVDGVGLVARAWRPSSNGRSDDEMRPDPAPLMRDHLHMAVEGGDLRRDADLFHEFRGERGGKRLTHLDDAPRQPK